MNFSSVCILLIFSGRGNTKEILSRTALSTVPYGDNFYDFGYSLKYDSPTQRA